MTEKFIEIWEFLKLSVILLILFTGLPLALLYITESVAALFLGYAIGLLIMRLITKNGHAWSDADI